MSSASDIFNQFGYITEDFICASFVSSLFDWIFSFIPVNSNNVIISIISLFQLTLSFTFTLSLRNYLGKNISPFLPLFVWHWSPHANAHLSRVFRNLNKIILGTDTMVPESN